MRERCLRPVLVRGPDWDAARTSLLGWNISDRIFPAWCVRIPTPRERALRLVATCQVDYAIQSPRQEPGQRALRTRPTRIALLSTRSIANKAFTLSDLFTQEKLNFLCLTETWQRENEHVNLKELCPPDCSVFGTPCLARRGGGLALIYRDSFCCRVMDNDSFNSFELQMCKVQCTLLSLCFSVPSSWSCPVVS